MRSCSISVRASTTCWVAVPTLASVLGLVTGGGLLWLSTAAPWTLSMHMVRLPDWRSIWMFDAYMAYDVQYQEVHKALRWRGMQILNHPNDLFAIADFLWEERPDVLIEFGTNTGAAALFYADAMLAYSSLVHVITIDVVDYVNSSWNPHGQSAEALGVTAASSSVWGSTVRHIVGQPTSKEVRQEVDRLLLEFKASSIFLIEDGEHSKESVLANLHAYHHLIRPCGWIQIHDTKMEHLYWKLAGRGPLAARDEFLRMFPEYEVNRAYEYFGYTQHPGGWLRKGPAGGGNCSIRPCRLSSPELCRDLR